MRRQWWSRSSRLVPAVCLLVLLVTVLWANMGVGQTFPAPGASGWVDWPARQAQQDGSWEVSGPSGDGKYYAQPQQAGAALTFPIELSQTTTLRLRPVWWPTGKQRLARRYPYPLAREVGPSALAALGGRVYATAPAAGRVIVIDAAGEQVLGAIEVGGYVADLVADEAGGVLYAADALGNSVVVIDPGTGRVAKTIAVPGGPWALLWRHGVLYVACREGKRVVAVDPSSGGVVRQAALPAEPISLELFGDSLLVRFQQRAYDVFSLAPAPAEEQQFDLGGPRGVETPHRLEVDTPRGPQTIDTSIVTDGPTAEGEDVSFGNRPGPSSVVELDTGRSRQRLVAFLSPRRGMIGVFDPASHSLYSIPVGGYPISLAAYGGKLYAADPARDRIMVVDPRTRAVEAEIAVPGEPWDIVAVPDVAVQRREPAWPPKPVDRLYIVCRKSEELAVANLLTNRIVTRVPLPAAPRAVGRVPLQTPDWGPLPYDRIHLMLQPRVAVELAPVALALTTLQPSQAPLETPEAAPKHDAVSALLPGGERKAFSAANDLVVGAEGKRWIDISRLADPQLLPAAPLHAQETPGSITLSVDDGPEYDWAAGIWQSPDDQMFLVGDSERFWRYNALRLRLEPGQHVVRVRAHSPYVRLEALAVARAPELEVALAPEPREVHGQVPLASYQGVFYDQEPVRFALSITNRASAAGTLRISQSLRDYLGGVSEPAPPQTVTVPAGGTVTQQLALSPDETGRFLLRVTIDSPDGQVVKEARFLRLPKLEHPRLLYRKADLPAIQARMAQYPTLFQRYGDWLERMSRKEGRFPDRFLPPGLSTTQAGEAAPAAANAPANAAHIYDLGRLNEMCAWRNYELAWRMLGVQFAASLIRPDSAAMQEKIDALLMEASTDPEDYYFPDQFHYHGPFFPGAEAMLLDGASDAVRAAAPVTQLMKAHFGDMDRLSWALATLEEPLTSQKRALIYEIMTMENNAEEYFEAHRGTRGGTWWLSPYSGCPCPMHGYTTMFLFLRNVFGEPRLFEKPLFADYFTFTRYADPIGDRRGVQSDRRSPHSEPLRWILASLSRQPLERSSYPQWEEWIRKMNGPLPGDERAAVDRLMALEGMDLRGPLEGGMRWFVSGVSVPLALALGWYEPEAPQVTLQEMPPSVVFDVEGWATMRSGWDKDATEVTLISGVQEHTSRHKPNHLTIVKGGEYLLGTPAVLGDDGNSVGVWANSVVVDDAWREAWGLNLQFPRDEEHLVINRFSPITWRYLARDAKLVGYRAPDEGYGAGLDLHGHTENAFNREGRLLAYQTWPRLDYAAGDAANSWPADEVSQIDRQVVFVKPNLVVVYDRVALGPAGRTTRWIAATGPALTVQGNAFTVRSGTETLRGQVLLPANAVITTPEPGGAGWDWKDQRFLSIEAAAPAKRLEYLVVLALGEASAQPKTDLVLDRTSAGVRIAQEGGPVEVRFHREGPVGGEVVLGSPDSPRRYELREAMEQGFRNWRDDPRGQSWLADHRFDFLEPQGSR